MTYKPKYERKSRNFGPWNRAMDWAQLQLGDHITVIDFGFTLAKLGLI